MAFCQLVLGPPGAGKTTYCAGMQQFLNAINRDVAVVNLDPANDTVPYACDVDVGDLITVTDVMESMELGPNGAMVYCIEYLEKNMDWLEERLRPLIAADKYLVIDFPGQVELYTNHMALRRIVTHMTRRMQLRMTAVHLVDSHHCVDASKFISVLLLSLNVMCHLELPHVNVLSKIDMIASYGELPFGLDFFTEVLNLDFLLDHLQGGESSDSSATTSAPHRHKQKRFTALNRVLCELVEDYNLVSFLPLNISDKHSVARVLRHIDKSNGYVFGAHEKAYGAAGDGAVQFFQTAMQSVDHLANMEVEHTHLAQTREHAMTDDDIAAAAAFVPQPSKVLTPDEFAALQQRRAAARAEKRQREHAAKLEQRAAREAAKLTLKTVPMAEAAAMTATAKAAAEAATSTPTASSIAAEAVAAAAATAATAVDDDDDMGTANTAAVASG